MKTVVSISLVLFLARSGAAQDHGSGNPLSGRFAASSSQVVNLPAREVISRASNPRTIPQLAPSPGNVRVSGNTTSMNPIAGVPIRVHVTPQRTSETSVTHHIRGSMTARQVIHARDIGGGRSVVSHAMAGQLHGPTRVAAPALPTVHNNGVNSALRRMGGGRGRGRGSRG